MIGCFTENWITREDLRCMGGEIQATLAPKDDEVSTGQTRRFKGHLLVAEDNAANRELMRIILNRYDVTYEMVTDGGRTFLAKIAQFGLSEPMMVN